MSGVVNFQVLSEKVLPQPADPTLLAYCPSMDLVALVTTDQQVLIYRSNGQRVYGATQKASSLRVESIRWKPNGQLLAIAWSDGSVRLVSAETSKVVHQFTTGQQGADHVSGVTCMRWVSNVLGKADERMLLGGLISSWEQMLRDGDDSDSDQTPLDLPRDLSLIDIEPALPKLSTLPSGGGSEDVFSSRSSLDTLFQPFDPKDNYSVDIMVVGTKEGNLHLSIYDSFVIGDFETPVCTHTSPAHLVLHASHKKYSTHSLLMRSLDSKQLCFATMDLPFVTSSTSSKHLSLLASRSTALQNLLRYIHQVQIQMTAEWKSTQDLPARFLRNINETLAEQNQGQNIVQALYHSLATGHTFPVVKEWLVDELAERGHKRWDKAVMTGLENLKRIVHENLLPAIERCSVILSRFSGIAQFQGDEDSVGFSNDQIIQIEDTVASLHLLSSKVLMQIVDELELFAAFSTWLRYEIDRLASDTPPSPNEEMAEKEASIDHSKVLLYLQESMLNSPLAAYFKESSAAELERWNFGKSGTPIFKLISDQIKKQDDRVPYTSEVFQFEPLCTYLSRQASTIFAQIAASEKNNVKFGKPLDVGEPENSSPIDMRMSQVDDSMSQTHIAFIPKGLGNTVQIIRIELLVKNGTSSIESIEVASIKLGGGQVQDVKFWDDNVLLVLLDLHDKPILVNIPYEHHDGHSGESQDFTVNYTPYTQSPTSALVTDTQITNKFSQFKLPADDSFAPVKMEIREGKRKRGKEDMRRLVLLAKNGLHYKVLGVGKADSGKGVANVDVAME